MSEIQGRRHGDLPVTLLSEKHGWVPPKSHNEEEIALLKAAQEGTAVQVREDRGIAVAKHFMHYVAQQEGVDTFGSAKIAEAAYSSAYYDFAQQSPDTPLSKRVGRKRTYLPVHVDAEGDITRQSIAAEASERFASASVTSNELVREMVRRGALALSRRQSLGLQLANNALLIASMPYAGIINSANGAKAGEGDDIFMQDMAHKGMEDMLRGIQDTTIETGRDPSLAQLAMVRSPLTMHIDNNGGAQASEALEYAQDMASSEPTWYEWLAA